MPGPRNSTAPERRRRRLLGVASPILAITTIVSVAGAQDWRGAPAPADDLRAALANADAGAPGDLVKLADGGRADAQAYAARLYIFGRGSIAPNPARGCAYAERASASRADALYILGECRRRGLNGPADPTKAAAAFERADQMGYPPAKCALGEVLMANPAQAARGFELCRQAAAAGDVQAQVKVGDLYRKGGPVKADPGEARTWYGKASALQNAEATRKLGEMYAAGEGGKRDKKEALRLWQTAEKGGDPFSPMLVADQLFSDLTGGKQPGPGKFAFRGGIPVADIEVIEDWYRQALQRDPRPEAKTRAQMALNVLASFKTAAKSVP
jgi:TPR repeat protein